VDSTAKAASNPETYNRISRAAIKHCHDRYSREKHLDELIAAINAERESNSRQMPLENA